MMSRDRDQTNMMSSSTHHQKKPCKNSSDDRKMKETKEMRKEGKKEERKEGWENNQRATGCFQRPSAVGLRSLDMSMFGRRAEPHLDSSEPGTWKKKNSQQASLLPLTP